MSTKIANFVSTTLAADISNVATAFAVGSTSDWPVIGVGDHFYLVLVRSNDNAREIIKVTSYSAGNVDVCVRAQEGTGALAFSAGDSVELWLTAAGVNEIVAVPSLTLTVSGGALSKSVACQSSVAGYFIVRAWLVDGSTPTDQVTLNPPDGTLIAQQESITDATGLVSFTFDHTGSSTSWYLCAMIVGRVPISSIITIGT